MRKKGINHKKNKIRLILLEGKSDEHFYKSFKKKYAQRELDVFLLGRVQNFKKINDNIENSIKDLGYKQVWLVLDLKTQKKGTERYYLDKDELLKEYEENLKNYNLSDMVVMIQDLESWLLLYFNKYKNTETIKNAESRIKQLMDIKEITSKPQVTQWLLKRTDFWDKLIKYKNKNNSFRDFVYRVDPNL